MARHVIYLCSSIDMRLSSHLAQGKVADNTILYVLYCIYISPLKSKRNCLTLHHIPHGHRDIVVQRKTNIFHSHHISEGGL